MKVLCICVGLILAIKADYHDKVGIPLAARIKAYEDKLFAEVPDKQSRIIGGEIAPVFAHPYLVGLILRVKEPTGIYFSICGSSLVSSTRLVTAAHCVQRTESLKAVFGTTFLFHGGTRIITRNFVAHPKYNGSYSADYDIGVVKLPYAIQMDETIHRIRLPETPDDEERISEWAVAAGWGLSSESERDQQVSKDLLVREVSLQIIKESVCEKQYHSYDLHSNFICTSGANGVGGCDGDSGGPLFVMRNGKKILIGVISHGSTNCERGLPSVFTKVKSFLDFIKNI